MSDNPNAEDRPKEAVTLTEDRGYVPLEEHVSASVEQVEQGG